MSKKRKARSRTPGQRDPYHYKTATPPSYTHRGCGGELVPQWAEAWDTVRTEEDAVVGEWFYTCTKCKLKGLIPDG